MTVLTTTRIIRSSTKNAARIVFRDSLKCQLAAHLVPVGGALEELMHGALFMRPVAQSSYEDVVPSLGWHACVTFETPRVGIAAWATGTNHL